ncbi:MAG: alpha/beta hydrolase [Thermoleophilia bacterium]|jgi:pimeloyl-ACP methyl ester carboxylesterase|nr:alpha/beta hydrolase [Thermoleophilia bacterium]
MTAGLAPGSTDLGAVRLHWLAAGDGPLVLCLHGFPDHAPTLRPLVEHLAGAGFRAVAPFMRGYAPSTVDAPGFEPAALARDALDLADALAPGRPVRLVGHDWGGVAALHAAQWAPARVERVVSVAMPHARAFATALRRDPGQLRRSWYEFLFLAEGFAERVVADDGMAFLDRLVAEWSPGGAMLPEEWEAVKRTLALPGVIPAALGYYRAALLAGRRDPALAEVAAAWAEPVPVPALLIVGADDGCIAPSVSEGQERYFTGPYRREVIPGVGHWPHREAPAVVEPMIAEFLAA